jgi:hypothetical protein
MKKKIIFYAILLLMVVPACKDPLVEDPKGMINENFLATEDGLRNLVLSQYYQSRLIVEHLRYLGPFPSDIFTHSVNGPDAIKLSSVSTSEMPALGAISDSWQDLYAGINNMNFGLKALKENTFSGANTMAGELSFLRAWYYLLVVETWGQGAHFTTEPTAAIITEGNQTTIDVFYSLILSDIDKAIEKLPETVAERGRISKPAAKAMKARILLALAGYSDDIITKAGIANKTLLYTQAKQLADEVINNANYKLLDDYESIFDVHNEGNAEIIWSVQFTNEHKFNTSGMSTGGHGLHRYWVGNYNRSARTQQIVPRMYGHSVHYGREYRHAMMTRYFVTMFDEQDARRDATIQTVWYALWNESEQKEDAFGVPFKNGVLTDTVLFKPLYEVDNATAAKYAARGIAIDGLNHIYNADGTPKQAARSWYHTMKKYLDPSREVPKEESSHKDVIVLRLAEQYLIAAECAHFLGNNTTAAGYIDQLRERARKTPDALPVHAGGININFILDERARELGGELFRWFDLKRTHQLVGRLKEYNPDARNVQVFHELRPVPQSELDKVTNRAAFKQNPGYPN